VLGLVVVYLAYPSGSGLAPNLIAAAALILSPLATWLVHNRLALVGNITLRRRLKERLDEEGEALPTGVKPVFVGFSPGEEPLAWEGDTDRDIGFLAAWGDTLVYRGDSWDWSLPRDRIDIIEPMQPVAGVPRILIRWHGPRESNRAFTIVSREAADLRGAREATNALLQQLYAWVARPADSEVEPPKLGMPPTDTSGGRRVDAVPGGSCLVTLAVVAVTTVAAWQVGGPLVDQERYALAILAAGCVFAIGFSAIHIIVRLLQWAEEQDKAAGDT
jgi:hypothetical protein